MITDIIESKLKENDEVDVTADGELVTCNFRGIVIEVNKIGNFIVVEDQEDNTFCVDSKQCTLVHE